MSEDAASPPQAGGGARGRAVIFVEDFTMDILRREAHIGGAPLALAPKEFVLLYTLLEQIGQTVGHAVLSDAVGAIRGDRSVDSIVYRVRKKLAGSGYHILADHKQGYRLEKE